MPSITAESAIPTLAVHAFACIGLEDHRSRTEQPETPFHPLPVSHFNVLGAVLDLQPIPRHQRTPTEEEDEERDDYEDLLEEDDSNNTLLVQAQVSGLGSIMLPGMETPETLLLYNDELDDGTLQQPTGMIILSSEYGEPGYEVETSLLMRRESVNTTECVLVPSSEHVAEIVGRQGCKIKALRAKTNTYIKTPVRGEQPMFVVTGRKEDVSMAKREILSAAEHFSLIRASRNKAGPLAASGSGLPGAPSLPGQTTIQVRVPYRVVGLVVGPKGSTIKRIQQQTHTYIVTPSRDKEPVFEVTGMPENVDRAREEIETHIAMRTGNCVEIPGDENDFHYNGTDVSFEVGGCGAWLQSTAAAPAGAQRTTNCNNSVRMTANYRNDSSSSLGSGSTDSYHGGGGNRMADFSPTSPFNANSNNNNNGGASFWFGETLLPLAAEELAALGSPGFDPLAVTTAVPAPQPQVVWSTLEQCVQLLDGRQAPVRDSQPGTPRLSPTFQEALEHPMAQRVHRVPFSASESQKFPVYGPAFSTSSDSTSSPPDSCRGRQVCIRCLESEIIAALVPCGHNLFCIECANRICQGPEAVCPVCQAPVTQAIRLRNM
ncbi:hypothetical protein J4Q44_G00236870 [Coregonus suidteri]|uniref:RING-type domain-containing protein n=1 Tax=Coregonus suidteri TaxID=861788 RepID=A0AAN8LE79_9TELE